MLEATTITPWSLCFFLHKNAPVVLAKLGFLSLFSSIPGKSEMQRFKEKEGGDLAIEPICFPSAYTFFTKQTTFSTRKTEHKEFIWDQHPLFLLEICAELSLEKELHLSCLLCMYGSQIKPSLPPGNISQIHGRSRIWPWPIIQNWAGEEAIPTFHSILFQ